MDCQSQTGDEYSDDHLAALLRSVSPSIDGDADGSLSQSFDFDELYRRTLSHSSGPAHTDTDLQPGSGSTIFVRSYLMAEDTKLVEMKFNENETLRGFKKRLVEMKLIHPEPTSDRILRESPLLRGVYDNCDDVYRTLREYGITDKTTLCVQHASIRIPGLSVVRVDYVKQLPAAIRDRNFDYNFIRIKESRRVYHRGGQVYHRPIGSFRVALKVFNKFGNNKWLGVSEGKRARESSTKDSPGEWPVSYHGTDENNCRSIAEEGYLLSKAWRCTFGYGIYTTPDFNLALSFAKRFKYNGNTYKFVLQNRVNPATLEKIPAEVNGSRGEYWISKEQKDVRAYGICIVKC